KIVRVLKKQDESAPHHVLLVLDATVGQNALSQTDAFKETAGVTGLVMTKLDGTAKGGVLVALADRHPELPIYFAGVGEGIDDLQPFDAAAFARALADASNGAG
ncbi:MAG: signal recognition particle-docking protein FtsY, partial [Caulobacterales bacterium]|nr:signal recognition particle-docking protein FtsY [Caulobacterales bacterium]